MVRFVEEWVYIYGVKLRFGDRNLMETIMKSLGNFGWRSQQPCIYININCIN